MSEDKFDQHGLPVSGYVAQSDLTISLVNRNKEIEERVLRILDDLNVLEYDIVNPRWLAAGRTDIEKGFMAVNRPYSSRRALH